MSIRVLPEKLQETTICDNNEIPDKLQQDIECIIRWVVEEIDPCIQADPQWIVAFLRGTKFNYEKAKKKLKTYYAMYILSRELYFNRNPFNPEIQTFYKKNIFVMLPNDPNLTGPSRCLLIAKNADPDNISVTTAMKAILMVTDMLMHHDDVFVVNGQEAILDLDGVPYGYASQLTPMLIKTMVTLMQDTYPMKVKGIHLINASPFVHVLIKTFKSLLSYKIKNRVYSYTQNDMESLYKRVPKSVFPKEYGGEAGTVSELSSKLIEKLESYKDWFNQGAECASSDLKTLKKQSKLNSDMGTEGTFKKLEVD